ncbi:MAG TPA: ABC transporter ATP-binding protein [Casimicrobiaceae bacterium]|nr:ABC transporter ATP-binding protein [Casimicrobiaceae bacterium]
MTAIALTAADKLFANGVRALQPVTLAVEEGEFVTIVGPSGCGKSTLLRLVAALTEPTTGRVGLWPGAPAAFQADRRRLAFVFQSAMLLAWADVEKNVRLPFDLGHARAADRELAAARVNRALAVVGLEEFRRAYPRELSGGMQMRVSIARALVTQPALLLMDEPFAALDEITRLRLDRELAELWVRERLTVLFVTHSIFEAVFLSTRVLVMSARPGRIVGEVAIDEPQPRAESFRLSTAFAGYCARLSQMLATGMEPTAESAAA